jgi:hypothetical protein
MAGPRPHRARDPILSDVRTLWWFGPLLALVALGIGRKGMFRLAKYVASVFMHTHTLS